MPSEDISMKYADSRHLRVTILTKAGGKLASGRTPGPEGKRPTVYLQSPPPGYDPQPMGTSRHAQPAAMIRILPKITTHAFPNFGTGDCTGAGFRPLQVRLFLGYGFEQWGTELILSGVVGCFLYRILQQFVQLKTLLRTYKYIHSVGMK